MVRVILILHLLGASVWVGGHLVLLLAVLPKALRLKDPGSILAFEERYERVAVPALLLQLLTGLWLANRFVPGVLPAFTFVDRLHAVIATKLMLLMATVMLGAHARLRIIPGLTLERSPVLAWHILLITVFAITLLVLGAWMRPA
ncbi:MAG: copper resistance protein CopD [Flavobacteriales bacterium]|nr:copper resistance protein CopD [Flavobacteriales bacterium]